MIYKLKKDISLENLIKGMRLNYRLLGNKSQTIDNFCSIKYSNLNSISFIEDNDYEKYKNKKGFIILNDKKSFFKNQIISKEPRLLFCKIVNSFLKEELKEKNYPTKNFKDFHLKKNILKTIISENVFIGKNVSIGKNCYIGKNVVIYPGTKISDNVIIFDNTVLGIYGLGYIKGTLMPHLGNLIIKNNVKIGANCTIVRGTLDNTVIGESVKIGNNVNISHNVKISKNSIIASSSVVAGGVEIKSDCQISGGVSIKNNIIIGKKSKIGIGAVVIKDVNDKDSQSTYFGNPARKTILLKKLF